MARGTILLIGRDGQVGRALERTLAPLGPVVATHRSTLDLTNPARVRETIRATRPGLIVNAAAYTAVDRAESDSADCFAVNARAPEEMALAAHRAGIPLVHFSTDYVFDGAKGTPYVESDATAPLNVYGRSKLEGERALLSSGADVMLFRLGWVYDTVGRNFFTTIRRLAAERDVLGIVDDQRGVPTWSGAVAEAVATLVRRLLAAARGDVPFGLYHMSGTGSATWAQFAAEILRAAPVPGREHVLVAPIGTAEYPTPARRPAYSVMDSGLLARTFNVALDEWQTQLHACVAEGREPSTRLPGR